MNCEMVLCWGTGAAPRFCWDLIRFYDSWRQYLTPRGEENNLGFFLCGAARMRELFPEAGFVLRIRAHLQSFHSAQLEAFLHLKMKVQGLVCVLDAHWSVPEGPRTETACNLMQMWRPDWRKVVHSKPLDGPHTSTW